LPENQRAFVNELLAAGKPAVVASFGSPYLIERFPNAQTWLAEFSTNDVSQRAVARALVGQVAISGEIPVTVPGTVKRGEGLQVAAAPRETYWTDFYTAAADDEVFDVAFPVG